MKILPLILSHPAKQAPARSVMARNPSPAMTQDRYFKYVVAAIVAGVFVALIQPAQAAEEKERTRKRAGTYSTSEGKSGAMESTVTRRAGEVERDQAVTNQDGQTATRKAKRSRDQETGTGTYASTTTAPSGKTATTTSTSQLNGDGSVSTTGARTGFNGQTGTYESTTAKADDGRTTTGTVTNAAVKSAAYSATATHADGTASKAQTLTTQNGQTTERVVATKKNPDGTITRTIQITAPDGTTSTRTETVTVTSAGKN
jgi:hypothetical protein